MPSTVVAEPAQHDRRSSSKLSRGLARVTPGRSAVRGGTSFICGLVLWEWLARSVWADSLFFPPISEILSRLREMWADGEVQPNITTSLKEYSLGLLIATVAGLTIGIASSASKFLYDVFEPYLAVWNATPSIALAPLLILVFGIGIASKVATVVIICTIPIILNTRAGISTTDAQLIEMGRSFGASPWQIYRHVALPNAVPHILTGLRLAASYGFIAIVVGELYGARAGVGLMIQRASERFDSAALFVGVGLLGLGGVVTTYGLRLLERRIAPWRYREMGE